MGDTITLDFLGATLRSIQAEQRTLRMENELMRKDLGRIGSQLATREELLEVLRVLAERLGGFEAMMQTRLDQLGAQNAQTADRLDQLGGQFAQVMERLPR